MTINVKKYREKKTHGMLNFIKNRKKIEMMSDIIKRMEREESDYKYLKKN